MIALAVLAAVALLAAAASGLAAVLGDDDDPDTALEDRDEPDDDPSPTSPPSSDPDEPSSNADFDAVVQELQAFVEEERGLPFLRDVTVELADDAEFTERYGHTAFARPGREGMGRNLGAVRGER